MVIEREQSKAHDYLRRIMEKYQETEPPNAETLAVMRDRFHKILDQEMNSADTDARRKRLKALAVGGGHAFDRMGDVGSEATAEIFNDLVDIATGVRGRNGLAPETPRSKQRTAAKDWEIAKAIVALERTTAVTPELEKRILAKTGMTSKKVRKMMDNMDQGRGRYDDIKINLRDIKSRLANGETWMIDDLLT